MTDEPLIDLEVGRFALRTFRIIATQGRLMSVVKDTFWDDDGTCVAKCLADPPCPEPPGDDCHCGVYGALSVSGLISQYSQARRNMAVIAAEGIALVGERGLRAQAARIVAYWASQDRDQQVYARVCPDAAGYDSMIEMAAAYGFRCEHRNRVSLGMVREDDGVYTGTVCRDCGERFIDYSKNFLHSNTFAMSGGTSALWRGGRPIGTVSSGRVEW